MILAPYTRMQVSGDNTSVLSLQPFGKYTLVAKLAEGGMAEIFLAVEEMPHVGRRFVIIKRIRESYESDLDYQDFFITEGRVALRVAHPNLPHAYELGTIDGVYYLAMEFIRGPTVLDLLRRAQVRRTALSVQSCVTIARAVCAALEHVHELCDVDGKPLRVIHRDVTPQNTLVAYDGTVRLIDFGIAQAAVQTHTTAAGVVKGKFSYLAPEQITRDRPVDHRADLFSLGIMFHEALCGRVLFRGRTDRETVQNVLGAQVPSPTRLRPAVPEAISRVVLRALERHPDDRYPDATAMLRALETAASAAHLDASLVSLRGELRDLCGSPQEYVLPALESVEIDMNEDEEDDDPITETMPRDPRGRALPVSPTHAPGGDDDLHYFLSRAGVVVPSKRARRLRTTRTDVEFAELLATLER